MDYFFSIELRDHIKKFNITSLMIWYSGHGKYISPTGYWIPTDGELDNEFSYYSVNAVRVAMQSYVGRLTHILLVTDACESGATFLAAMRGNDLGDKSCDNTALLRSKSAQVFTSAGNELASDKSYFTRYFASELNNNTDRCLPIEKIVKKVSMSVSKTLQQAPKFGKIKDIDDDGGTFFFVRKN